VAAASGCATVRRTWQLPVRGQANLYFFFDCQRGERIPT
jgi:hypothetical protein